MKPPNNKRPTFADLGDHGEDVRIDTIGHAAMNHRKKVAFMTEDEPGKAERYIEKLQERFPGIRITGPRPGPTRGVVMVIAEPPL
jgi:hypothetical protein